MLPAQLKNLRIMETKTTLSYAGLAIKAERTAICFDQFPYPGEGLAQNWRNSTAKLVKNNISDNA